MKKKKKSFKDSLIKEEIKVVRKDLPPNCYPNFELECVQDFCDWYDRCKENKK